ncbi:hypothetical protein TNCV_1353991 [Trichonephila clavipes]|nr:hypothetical protein TNCV_1353991 [Trichonephila clavipes]
MTPELAPTLLTTTPHQREDVSALDRFKLHRCPTRRVFSGTGLELVTRSDTYTTRLPRPLRGPEMCAHKDPLYREGDASHISMAVGVEVREWERSASSGIGLVTLPRFKLTRSVANSPRVT